jgi:formylglycine-generating enzyme
MTSLESFERRAPGLLVSAALILAGCSPRVDIADEGDGGREGGAGSSSIGSSSGAGSEGASSGSGGSGVSSSMGTSSGTEVSTEGGTSGFGSSSGSSGDGPEPPSCASGGAGMTDCGESDDSCCTSLAVAGGTYYRTYTNDGSGPTALADPAGVSGFRLDKYEVTVGRFRQFVAAWNGGSGWTPPAGSGKHTHLNGGQGLANSGSPGTYEAGWIAADDGNVAPTDANLACGEPNQTWTPSVEGNEHLPINCVNWQESYAFCIWDGGFLPSESEWEYAAAGGSEQREYPWGSNPPGIANDFAIYNCSFTTGGLCGPAPVGSATLGAGAWGQLDVAGNVLHWDLDWYATYVDPCTDCAFVTTSPYRVPRGAGFDTSAATLPSSFRNTFMATPPSARAVDLGFRCARTP